MILWAWCKNTASLNNAYCRQQLQTPRRSDRENQWQQQWLPIKGRLSTESIHWQRPFRGQCFLSKQDCLIREMVLRYCTKLRHTVFDWLQYLFLGEKHESEAPTGKARTTKCCQFHYLTHLCAKHFMEALNFRDESW